MAQDPSDRENDKLVTIGQVTQPRAVPSWHRHRAMSVKAMAADFSESCVAIPKY